jgi:hypothetical protein
MSDAYREDANDYEASDRKRRGRTAQHNGSRYA